MANSARHDQLAMLRPHLVAYARAIGAQTADAEDLVQEAILRALSASTAPAAPEDLRPWMFRVIRNLHLDERRKLKVRAEYSARQERFSEERLTVRTDPLASILVRQALGALTSDHREILFLVDVMEMRYSEAADVLGVPEGTVMSRVSRARRAMLDQLSRTNVEPLRSRRGQR